MVGCSIFKIPFYVYLKSMQISEATMLHISWFFISNNLVYLITSILLLKSRTRQLNYILENVPVKIRTGWFSDYLYFWSEGRSTNNTVPYFLFVDTQGMIVIVYFICWRSEITSKICTIHKSRWIKSIPSMIIFM